MYLKGLAGALGRRTGSEGRPGSASPLAPAGACLSRAEQSCGLSTSTQTSLQESGRLLQSVTQHLGGGGGCPRRGGRPNNSPESHGPYGPGERCCLRSLHGKRQLFPGSLVTRPGRARRRTWALLKARGRSRETSARATRVHRAPKAWRLLCSPGLLRAAGPKDSQVLRHGELPWTRAFLKTGAQEFNELFACRVGQNL